MFSVPQLVRLARIYCDATGMAASRLGEISCANNRVFVRLLSHPNPRLMSDTAERASAWLAQNWPADLSWPEDIPHPGHEKAFSHAELTANAPRGA